MPLLLSPFDGIVTSWNPAAEKLFGYTGEEIIGKSAEIVTARPTDSSDVRPGTTILGRRSFCGDPTGLPATAAWVAERLGELRTRFGHVEQPWPDPDPWRRRIRRRVGLPLAGSFVHDRGVNLTELRNRG